ncbi:hypothetical protein [Dokdonia pacifica]|uniref:Uncharacterized protein n=1 Tax=Dokdonia pacifica TaxID=1627892 RepID=A0A238W4H6_9FLAO|nr:hypothetical protein [Dokdonia pacifica]SNR41515.1 hypothetical protein SAMN06265376_101689 [Dokdonia pacifica]
MNKIVGICIVVLALFFCWYYGHMVFEEFSYKNQSIFICFRPPVQISIINTVLSLFGMVIGIKIYQSKLKMRKAILVLTCLLTLGFVLEVYGYKLF